MNKNSLICNFLAKNPTDWEELLNDEYGIKVKKDGVFAIFNYAVECDFSDPIVQEARGIIIDLTSLEVVCWPFRKFGNYNESYVDTIDWNSARVLEKVDGSIVKLWFDKTSSRWQFSTNGMIRAEKALVENMAGLSYGDVINSAKNVNDIPYERLNKNYTYIFELVSPQTRIVVQYDAPLLYHLGTRDNLTGQEFDIDIGIKKPHVYPLNSLENCIAAAIALNKDNPSSDDVDKEGFVVVDKNWHRVKVKSPDYIMMHHVSMMKYMTKKECVRILLYERERLDIILKKSPDVVPLVKYYDYKIAELFYNADKMALLAKRLFNEYGNDRKAVARIIAKHKLAMVGFRSIDTGESGTDVLFGMQFDKLCKLIPDYVPEDMSLLFVK